jgi:hypothetical protein
MAVNHEQDIIQRWQRAAQRALDESVRVIQIDGQFRATSSSQPLASYLLQETPEGWACECIANHEYMMPCKHLWALAETLGLDVLQDMRVTWDPQSAEIAAA